MSDAVAKSRSTRPTVPAGNATSLAPFARVLVTSTVPDRLNNNHVLRTYAARGLRGCAPRTVVVEVPVEPAPTRILDFRPELVIAIGGVARGDVDLRCLRLACDRVGAKLAFWLHDDPYEFDFCYRAEALADAIFTNDAWAHHHYRFPFTHHLPLGACPEAHYRTIRPAAERDIDVLFCGVGYPNRIEFFRQVRHVLRPYRCVIIGDGWPPDLEFATNSRVSRGDLADLTTRALITLNITRHHDIANRRFSLPPSTPGPRTFETAMSGSTQFYLVHGLEVCEYFVPNSEIILIDNVADLECGLLRFCGDPMSAIRIAENAQARALRDHCYKSRMLELMQKANAFPARHHIEQAPQ